uniref:hypothetical protein n=1 Tax=Nocardia abscessus TaxID=120957 RepID=UPI0024540CD8
MVNVAVQLEILQRHPVIRQAAAARGLTVSGLFFDISTACVLEVTTDSISEIGRGPLKGAIDADRGKSGSTGIRPTRSPARSRTA